MGREAKRQEVATASARLSDEVADQIRHLITSENLAAGARLPSERQLATQFETSRPTVSQALRTLSLMGLVEIRQGSGAYVLRSPETMVAASLNLMLDLDRSSVGELLQLRLWLETLGVEEAARREPHLGDHEVGEIEGALERLAQTDGTASTWIAVDTLFHATIVRSAGNPYLAAVYESIHTAALKYEFDRWIEREAIPTWLEDTRRDERWALHRPIADAVIRRDWRAAREAVWRHHQVMRQHVDASAAASRHPLDSEKSSRSNG
jgi:GntR family transcriptional regulator, transcriptional repressor for pyruvate dehydrogenase complex